MTKINILAEHVYIFSWHGSWTNVTLKSHVQFPEANGFHFKYKERACLCCHTGHHSRKTLSPKSCADVWQDIGWRQLFPFQFYQIPFICNKLDLKHRLFFPVLKSCWREGQRELGKKKCHRRYLCVGWVCSKGRWREEQVYSLRSDGAELY